MSARPEGTDGSDHVFRERVDNSYKVLARCRKWGGLWLHATVPSHFLRFLYFVVGGAVAGLTLNYQGLGIFLLNLGALLSWKLAKPGSPRESLVMVKITGTCLVVGMGLFCVTCYKYHQVVPQALHVNVLLYTHLAKTYGLAGDNVRHILKQLDVTLDLICFCLQCIVIGNIHPYLKTQIDLQKQRQQIAMQSMIAKKRESNAAAAAKDDRVPATGAAKKRPARM